MPGTNSTDLLYDIGTRFRVGNVVYTVYVSPVLRVVACPVCEGRGSLVAGTHDVGCPECRCTGKLSQTTEYVGSIKALTIGEVQVRQRASKHAKELWDYERWVPDTVRDVSTSVSYMCEETGVGSGGVYPEHHLYATRAEAEATIPALVAARQIEHDERVEQQKKDTERRSKGRARARVKR